jgi:hypothetical protein
VALHSHSYALINQWQLLSLSKRKDIALSVRDAPYLGGKWRPTKGLFRAEDENSLASMPVSRPDEEFDAVLRISLRYDFSLRARGRAVVFGTPERQLLETEKLKFPIDIGRLSKSESFTLITPSRWSREAFFAFGSS